MRDVCILSDGRSDLRSVEAVNGRKRRVVVAKCTCERKIPRGLKPALSQACCGGGDAGERMRGGAYPEARDAGDIPGLKGLVEGIRVVEGILHSAKRW